MKMIMPPVFLHYICDENDHVSSFPIKFLLQNVHASDVEYTSMKSRFSPRNTPSKNFTFVLGRVVPSKLCLALETTVCTLAGMVN